MLLSHALRATGINRPVTLYYSTQNTLAASTNLSLSWGSDVLSGDVLVVVFGSSATGTNFAAPGLPGLNWTRILRQVNSDNDSIAVHARRLTSDGPGSVTFGSNTAGAKAYTFTIWRGAAANATALGSSNNTSSTNITAPSVTVSAESSVAAIMSAFFMDDATSGLTITLPASMEAVGDLQNIDNERYMRSGYKLNNPQGASGTFVAVASQSLDSVGATILIE